MSQVETFDLPPVTIEGEEKPQSVRLHRRPTHGQTKAIVNQYIAARDRDEPLDIQTILVLSLCTEWTVYDPDTTVPIPFTREGVESAPQDIVDAVFNEASKPVLHMLPNE